MNTHNKSRKDKKEIEGGDTKMSENKQLVNGVWTDAVEIPYYPSVVEKLQHRLLGKHFFYENKKCLICGIPKTK